MSECFNVSSWCFSEWQWTPKSSLTRLVLFARTFLSTQVFTISHKHAQVMFSVVSACLPVYVFVGAITFKLLELGTSFETEDNAFENLGQV